MNRLSRLQTRLTGHLDQISEARRRTLAASDPEGLHDLRVAIRGLRVVLALLGKHAAGLRQDWRTIARATGPSRDLEVMLTLIDALPDDLGDLPARLIRQEREARSKLLELLASATLPCLLQRSRSELAQIMRQVRMQALQARADRHARQYASIIRQAIALLAGDSPAEQWHQLRLDVKRLRYLIEHCDDCLPGYWQALHPHLKRSQSALGELHDIDMLIGISHRPLTHARTLRLATARDSVLELAKRL